MTEKQKKFCIEYLKDLNATQAAIRAGYSENTAYSIGNENLSKPEIKEYIDKQLESVMNESMSILKSRIKQELCSVAFTEEGIDAIRDKDGTIVSFRVSDKLKALELLGKYSSMFTDKLDLNHSGQVAVNIIDDIKAE